MADELFLTPLVITAGGAHCFDVGHPWTAPMPSSPSVMSPAAAAEALVRRFEASEGRQLLDTRLGGWRDMPSESVLKALAYWELPTWELPGRTAGVPLPRYLSVRDGRPQRFIDIHVLSTHRMELRLQQSQLLRAAELGVHGWLYAVRVDAVHTDAEPARPLVLQDPARAQWVPQGAADGAACRGADAVWCLPCRELLLHGDLIPAA